MNYTHQWSAVIAAFVVLGGACSSTNSGLSTGTGGAGGSGSGGLSGVGGVVGLGGAVGTGGQSTSGGTVGTGGRFGTGGTTIETGGTGTAGRDAGRDAPAGTGGAGTGGRQGTGGANGGAVDGGTSSAGGGGGASAGCGSANTTSPCSKSGTKCSLDVAGTARTYYVQLPASYSATKQYPVVFQFHPMGGSAEQALNEYGISKGLPDAIYITPQGLVSTSAGSDAGTAGWPNTSGQDIAFTKAMLADVQGKYCVDNARIFSVGFSYGGMMSFAVGCEMGDVFRAIAPMSGALYSDFNCKGSGHAVAMWGSHGLNDNVVPIADGRSALAKILQQNHCGTTTTPIDPSPCVSYQGCDPGYPVTWCEWDGTHNVPSFGTSAITAFFKSF
jgi:predicted esterase